MDRGGSWAEWWGLREQAKLASFLLLREKIRSTPCGTSARFSDYPETREPKMPGMRAMRPVLGTRLLEGAGGYIMEYSECFGVVREIVGWSRGPYPPGRKVSLTLA